MTFEPPNKTHYGSVFLEFLEDIPIVIFTVHVETPLQQFDHTVNLCNWMKNRRVMWMSRAFEEYFEKFLNPKLLTCPIMKGPYVAMEPRKFFTGIDTFLPRFIAMNNNITLMLILRVKKGKKLTHLITTTDKLQVFRWRWKIVKSSILKNKDRFVKWWMAFHCILQSSWNFLLRQKPNKMFDNYAKRLTFLIFQKSTIEFITLPGSLLEAFGRLLMTSSGL